MTNRQLHLWRQYYLNSRKVSTVCTLTKEEAWARICFCILFVVFLRNVASFLPGGCWPPAWCNKLGWGGEQSLDWWLWVWTELTLGTATARWVYFIISETGYVRVFLEMWAKRANWTSHQSSRKAWLVLTQHLIMWWKQRDTCVGVMQLCRELCKRTLFRQGQLWPADLLRKGALAFHEAQRVIQSQETVTLMSRFSNKGRQGNKRNRNESQRTM